MKCTLAKITKMYTLQPHAYDRLIMIQNNITLNMSQVNTGSSPMYVANNLTVHQNIAEWNISHNS